MATPILDLDSLVDRPTVVIGGNEYWLITLDIMPPLDTHRLQRGMQRVAALLSQAELTDDEQKELEVLPDTLCRLVLDAPDSVHKPLSNRTRMLIAETAVSTFRTGLRLPALTAPNLPAATSTGESGSLG